MSETTKRKSGKKKKRIFRRILGILIVLILLAGAGVYAWAKLRDQYTVTYDEYTATTGTISNSLSFSGSLALRDSETYTASGKATVRTVYVANGDEVKKGDKLVRLSNGSTVTADFDGRVNQVSVEVGDEVASGESLVQIADFQHMQVSFRVDEYDIGDVAVGDRCTVTATATEKVFESAVESINYISSSTGNVAYYTATAYVDVDGEVYPGMQVTVTIPQEEAVDVVVLKADALSFTFENQAFVFKMKEDETLEQVQVEVGVSNGNYVEIKSGLESGETVYVVSQVKEDSLNGLFSSMFGQTQFNRQNNNRQNGGSQNWQNRQNNNNGGSMPSGGAPGQNGGGR
ncbi:MAG: HlyD family efflux transporter periplasmic adaptor subunit [Clostridia bacterium]|nr:HlyD family efflux transporter periplasmic adaptor subunit [Clostridia bacterium]